MAVEEIPKSFRYICDTCGNIHRQENANNAYPYNTPPRWATIGVHINANKFDEDTGFERLLCDECFGIIRIIKEWKGRGRG
jgi:hypothetical protein